MLSASVNSK